MNDEPISYLVDNDPFPIRTPSEWGSSAWFFEGIEDKAQRRALALVRAFGTPGGGDRVCFIDKRIVIASPMHPPWSGDESEDYRPDVGLVVWELDEFNRVFTERNARDADEMTLRWIEEIVESAP